MGRVRARLNVSSKNSGKPPPIDPPGADRPKRPPSGRKPGGQPGHEETSRGPLPRAEVDRFVPVPPEKCGALAVLSGADRMIKRNIEEILGDLFGAKISLGSVVNLERTVSGAIAEPFEELRSHVKSSPVVHADETSWRIGGGRAWLWAAVVSFAAVF